MAPKAAPSESSRTLSSILATAKFSGLYDRPELLAPDTLVIIGEGDDDSVSIPAHRFVLEEESAWFKTNFTTPMQGNRQPSDGQPRSKRSRPNTAAPFHVSRPPAGGCSNDAAKAVIAFMYHHQAPDGDVELLMQMMVWADYWEVPLCVTACSLRLEEMNADEAGVSVSDLEHIMSCAAGWPEHLRARLEVWCSLRLVEVMPEPLAPAMPLLMALFGDALKVAGDCKRLTAFLELPGEAIRAWLESDQLLTDSENTVAYLLMRQNAAAHNRHTSALWAGLRILHLTPSYAQMLLSKGCMPGGAGRRAEAQLFLTRHADVIATVEVLPDAAAALMEQPLPARKPSPVVPAVTVKRGGKARELFAHGYPWKVQLEADGRLQLDPSLRIHRGPHMRPSIMAAHVGARSDGNAAWESARTHLLLHDPDANDGVGPFVVEQVPEGVQAVRVQISQVM